MRSGFAREAGDQRRLRLKSPPRRVGCCVNCGWGAEGKLSADADLSGVWAKASWDGIAHCDNNNVQSRKVLTLVIWLPLDLLHEVASASLSDAFLSGFQKARCFRFIPQAPSAELSRFGDSLSVLFPYTSR